MKATISLNLERCSTNGVLTIERNLQEIAIIKPSDLYIKVYYTNWPDTEVLEFNPSTERDFGFISFCIRKFNDIRNEIENFDFKYLEVKDEAVSIDTIQSIVCSYLNVPIEMLQSDTRKREVVLARQVAMFFSKSRTKASLATIGSHIGDKDHATVLHACKTVNNLIETDRKFRNQIDEINKRIPA